MTSGAVSPGLGDQCGSPLGRAKGMDMCVGGQHVFAAQAVPSVPDAIAALHGEH